jgi:putative acetyltransferase
MGEKTDKEKPPQLRPATNADAEGITALVFDVLTEYNLKPDPDDTDADLKDIEQSYFRQGGTFFVLETSDKTIIGSYGLHKADEQTCELRKMYLHPNHRAKGWGKHMMDHALAQAKKLRFTTMTLETASVLKEAINLYKTCGFTEHQPAHLSKRCDQAYILKL